MTRRAHTLAVLVMLALLAAALYEGMAHHAVPALLLTGGLLGVMVFVMGTDPDL